MLPQDADGLPNNINMATVFFARIFHDHERAERAMSALTAVCIAGNLWVMTFTAARVKQEIAKEGVLQPWSLTISTAYRIPWGLIRELYRQHLGRPLAEIEVDRAPAFAFAVHWFSSVILVAATAPITDQRKSYYVLVSLYAYTMVAVVGCWVCIGLLVIRFRESTQNWRNGARYYPWHSPIHAIVYGTATAFIAVAAFVPPKPGSPFDQSVTGLPYYFIPVIGITAPFWGLLWYYAVLRRMRPRRTLFITRAPRAVPDPSNREEYIQESETIDQSWELNHRPRGSHDVAGPQSSTSELRGLSMIRLISQR